MEADVLADLEPLPDNDECLKAAGSLISCLRRTSTQRSALLAVVCSSQNHANAKRYMPTLGEELFRKTRDDAGFMALGHDVEVPLKTR
jgi:hypothetical protein